MVHITIALPNDTLSILSSPNRNHISLLLAIFHLILLILLLTIFSYHATCYISLPLTIFLRNCDFPCCHGIFHFLPLGIFSCHFPYLTFPITATYCSHSIHLAKTLLIPICYIFVSLSLSCILPDFLILSFTGLP